MVTKLKKKPSQHLENPVMTRFVMCGRSTVRTPGIEKVDTPTRTTCKTCRRAYEAGKKAYSAAKREARKSR